MYYRYFIGYIDILLISHSLSLSSSIPGISLHSPLIAANPPTFFPSSFHPLPVAFFCSQRLFLPLLLLHCFTSTTPIVADLAIVEVNKTQSSQRGLNPSRYKDAKDLPELQKRRKQAFFTELGKAPSGSSGTQDQFPLMLVSTNTYLRQRIFGVSRFHCRERQLSYRVSWTVSCLPNCLDTLDSIALKRLHLPASIKEKEFGYTKMSSQTAGEVNGKAIVGENGNNPRLSTEYETAMEALSSLITRPKRGIQSAVGGKYTKLERMSMYIQILGLEEHLAALKIVHIAGTKGKGSTCTFSEAILRECGFRTGLFTSPHLIDVKERFRLNGLEISEEQFLSYFWDCWNHLKEHVTEDLPMPPLFQFLTILGFKIFVCEKVDVAIIEVGLGGKRDSTNVIKEPVVCGIASLGMDHTEVLGDTLTEIASHKAGIFKPQVPAFTVPQLPEAMDVIQQIAHELRVPLEVAAPLTYERLNGVKLSLSGDHQLVNAGLAVSLCRSWLTTTGNWEKLLQDDAVEDRLPQAFLRGLSSAHIPGRAQIVHDSPSRTTENSSGDLIFYLDGAHSPESMEACAKWFSEAVEEKNGYTQYNKEMGYNKLSKKILLFNCMEVRDPEVILPRLANICPGSHFSKAIFVPSISTYNKVTSGASVVPQNLPAKDLSWQFNLQRIWEKIIHGKEIGITYNADKLPAQEFLYEDASGNFASSAVIPSLPLAINWLRDCARQNPSVRLQVLVTGSLHLVGDVLKLIRK